MPAAGKAPGGGETYAATAEVLTAVSCCICYTLGGCNLSPSGLATAPWALLYHPVPKTEPRGRVQRVSDNRDGHKTLAWFVIPRSFPILSGAKDGYRRRRWVEGSCRKTARSSAKPQRMTVRRSKILKSSRWHTPGQRPGLLGQRVRVNRAPECHKLGPQPTRQDLCLGT